MQIETECARSYFEYIPRNLFALCCRIEQITEHIIGNIIGRIILIRYFAGHCSLATSVRALAAYHAELIKT